MIATLFSGIPSGDAGAQWVALVSGFVIVSILGWIVLRWLLRRMRVPEYETAQEATTPTPQSDEAFGKWYMSKDVTHLVRRCRKLERELAKVKKENDQLHDLIKDVAG